MYVTERAIHNLLMTSSSINSLSEIRPCPLQVSNLTPWRIFDFLYPVELFHAESIDTLIDSNRRGCTSTRSDGVSRRVLLQLNVFVILHDVLFNIILTGTRATALRSWLRLAADGARATDIGGAERALCCRDLLGLFIRG